MCLIVNGDEPDVGMMLHGGVNKRILRSLPMEISLERWRARIKASSVYISHVNITQMMWVGDFLDTSQ